MVLEALTDLFGHGRVTGRFATQSLDKYLVLIEGMKCPVNAEVYYQRDPASEAFIHGKKRVESGKAALDFIREHISKASRGGVDPDFLEYSGRMQENTYGKYLTLAYRGRLADPVIDIYIKNQPGILGRIIPGIQQLKK